MAVIICKILGPQPASVHGLMACRGKHKQIIAQYEAISDDNGTMDVWMPRHPIYWGGLYPTPMPVFSISLSFLIPNQPQWINADLDIRGLEGPIHLTLSPHGSSYILEFAPSPQVQLCVKDSAPECEMADIPVSEIETDVLEPESLQQGKRKRKRAPSVDESNKMRRVLGNMSS